MDDLQNERRELMKEAGIVQEKEDVDEMDEKYRKQLQWVQDEMMEKLEVNPRNFYVFSRDMLRVDIGLMIQRPPIFVKLN
mmetsp:Transcript_17895/g.17109  ORF Transcript_17895/g.17109 Transcript_17895/m.17109 type:complete len:80 (+) Transcript_17895:114-353(+)